MMDVLIISATEMEIAPFRQRNPDQDVVITGLGMVSTVYALMSALANKNYDLIIQAGIGGSFTAAITRSEVVIIQKDTFADLGISENGHFKTLFDMGLANDNDFPFSNGWLVNPHNIINLPGLKKVSAITVNTVQEGMDLKQKASDKFNAEVESMEGAAFHFVCLNNKIPFAQLRSISNEVGIRDKNNWYIKEAVANLNHELEVFLQFLKT